MWESGRDQRKETGCQKMDTPQNPPETHLHSPAKFPTAVLCQNATSFHCCDQVTNFLTSCQYPSLAIEIIFCDLLLAFSLRKKKEKRKKHSINQNNA